MSSLVMISTAVAQVDTAENVVHSTVRRTEKAARTVAHGVKKAADTVEDAITPDRDARRVVTLRVR
jgi:phosphohistidine phosphatase SixA